MHRIGRTGRCGKTGIRCCIGSVIIVVIGVATTFINREVPETTLLDLKHLLQVCLSLLAIPCSVFFMFFFLHAGGKAKDSASVAYFGRP